MNTRTVLERGLLHNLGQKTEGGGKPDAQLDKGDLHRVPEQPNIEPQHCQPATIDV